VGPIGKARGWGPLVSFVAKPPRWLRALNPFGKPASRPLKRD
jgi:hypothetical protein